MERKTVKFLNASKYSIIILTIILLFIIAFVRLFFSYLDHYKEYFEKRASEVLHQPVSIESIDASWHGLWPVINFDNITVYDQDRQKKLLQVQRLHIVPNLLSSLFQQRIISTHLYLIGTTVIIRQLGDDAWSVNGMVTQFADKKSKRGDSVKNALNWFKQQGEIAFNHVNLYWYAKNGMEFATSNAQLTLPSDGDLRLIKLQSNNSAIKFNKAVSEPLRIDRLYIVFAYPIIEPNAELLLKEFVLANKDIKIKGKLRIQKNFQQNSSAVIRLVAGFSGTNIAYINDLIPQGFLKQGLADWLKTALIKSDNFYGKVFIQGPAHQFPYVNHEGRFESKLTIENLDLNYHHDWPIMTNMQANIFFDNAGLKVEVDKAKMLGIAAYKIHGDIPNLTRPFLNIHWDTQQSYHNLRQVIINSPLDHVLGKTLKQLEYTGPSKLTLNIGIPIHKNNSKEIHVDGTFAVMPNGILKVPEYKIILSKPQGSLRFTEHTLDAKDIKGFFLGHPATINVATNRDSKEIDIRAAGIVNFAALAKNYKLTLKNAVIGESPYKALLQFFSDKQQPHNILTINSNLSGATVHLPVPLKKSSNEIMPVKVQLKNSEKSRLLTLHYGKKLSGAIDFRKNNNEKWGIFSANIQLDNANAKIPKVPSIIVAGKIPQLNVAEITQQFSSGAKTGNFEKKWSAFLDFLGSNPKRVNLAFDQLNVYGMIIHQANIKINEIRKALNIKIASQEVAGTVSIPNNLANKPIQGIFQQFYFDSAIDPFPVRGFTQKLSPQENSVNPGNIPSLYLVFENFYYNKHPLGRICLSTIRQKNSMKIKEFTADFPAFSLVSTGGWSFEAGKQHTYFTGYIKTTSLGEFLKNWGITESVSGAKGTADFSLNWDGPAYNPDADKLNGQVKLAFKKGEILKVIDKPSDSGIGLILNLLTFEILKQILTPSARENSKKRDLDFSILRADLVIKNGNAYTDNIFLDGEMAKVKSAGRIGLGAQDYNLVLYVTPYIANAIVPGSSLPLVGSVIRGSLKIINKTIGSVLNGLFKRTYHVTGPWSNPSFDRVSG